MRQWRETLAALRARHPHGNLIAVFEPRSNTMKLGVMKDALPASLAEADLVYCYCANLAWNPAEVLAPLGAKAVWHDDLDAVRGQHPDGRAVDVRRQHLLHAGIARIAS